MCQYIKWIYKTKMKKQLNKNKNKDTIQITNPKWQITLLIKHNVIQIIIKYENMYQ